MSDGTKDMKPKSFKFIIEKPKRSLSEDVANQYVHIMASFPHVYYPIKLEKDVYHPTEDWQIDAAIAALKVKLIQEIANAEFEYAKI